jgi:uncharacterized protein
VKTRLQGALSAQQCAELHAVLARQALQTAVDSAVAEVELWCAGDIEHPFFSDCARRYGVVLRRQEGANLGARMAHALQIALRSCGFAIIIGTDCPVLDAGYLRRAAALLAGEKSGNRNPRVVIGPATDGGYVLFGANGPLDRAFENIEWGGSEVLRQTRERLQELRVTWKELESLPDIDRPGDLKHLPAGFIEQ